MTSPTNSFARLSFGALLILTGLAMPLSAMAAEIYVYTDANYSGASRHYQNDVQDLELEAFNDRLSSIRVVSGVWTICTDTAFGGRCEIISGDVANLHSTGLNDRISSLRVESSGSNESQMSSIEVRSSGKDHRVSISRRDGLTLFEGVNFQGRQVRVNGDTETLGEYDFNDDASSLRIEGGTWLICEDDNFGGRCEVVDSDVANLGGVYLNNMVSSVRRVNSEDANTNSDEMENEDARNNWWAQDRNDRWDRWEREPSYRADVFENSNYRGNHREFNGAIPDMTRNGFNDTISSFRIEGRWEVCEHVNFGGECEVFRFDDDNLVTSGWNDRISSMRPIGAKSQNQTGLLLFEDTDFRGDRARFSNSDPDLRGRGFDDTSSSLQIRNGRWEVCEDANYRGRCQQVDANHSNLTQLELDDRISSVRRLDDGNNDQFGSHGWGHDADEIHSANNNITIYQHANFEGRSLTFTNDVPNLAPLNFNDLLSSYRIEGGNWELCEDADYQGRCVNAQSDEDNVVPLGFNDRISSMRRVAGSDDRASTQLPPQIVVYEDANYGGRQRTYESSISNLSPDAWNDMISSFRISGPGEWEICEHSSFEGRCQTFHGNEPTLGSQGWNDRISSFRYLP